MIFGKKAPSDERPRAPDGPNGDPWDRETLEWLANTKMLGLRITHIERRYKAGPAAPEDRLDTGNPETIIAGYLPHAPQHVHLKIEFQNDLPRFGEGWLTYYMNEEHSPGRVNLPYLSIKVHDPDDIIKTGMLEAMRDAVASGEAEAEARAWIKPGDRWEGVSGGHGRTLDIDRMIAWAFTKSAHLANWALPVGELDLRHYPSPRRLRETPKK